MSALSQINALVIAQTYLATIHAAVRREPLVTHTLQMVAQKHIIQIKVTVQTVITTLSLSFY